MWTGESPGNFSPMQRITATRTAERGELVLPQGQAHRLAFQYQIVSPANLHRTNITQTETFAYVYAHIYVVQVMTKRP